MKKSPRIFDRWRLLAILGLLLSAGFFATTLSSYQVSKNAIREALVARELPLTSSNIYSEIQKDLVRPVLISSTMANDTFVRDWVLQGERDPNELARYLATMKERYGAFSSFFVSDRTGNYYTGEGILKQVSATDPRDAWYRRVRDMKEAYEINVDPDLANKDALTIFINYRVVDFSGNYIGATGIGLTVDAVRKLVADYQQRYQRTIYFVDAQGKIVLFGNQSGRQETNLRATEGLSGLADRILAEKAGSYQYEAAGTLHLVNVSYVPELKWYLFVEKVEDEALWEVRRTLYINLVICFVVTLVVVALSAVTLRRYQARLEDMASTDKLTGLLNRQAFDILMRKTEAELRRTPQAVAFVLADIDHFKEINDRLGHEAGDKALVAVAALLQERLRASDFAVRWGGEEFLLVLHGCKLDEANRIAETLRVELAGLTVTLDTKTLKLTASFGVSAYDASNGVEAALRAADACLYEAKAGGRNRVVSSYQ